MLFKKLNCPGAFDWWCPWQHVWFSGVSSWGFWVPQKGWGAYLWEDWGVAGLSDPFRGMKLGVVLTSGEE